MVREKHGCARPNPTRSSDLQALIAKRSSPAEPSGARHCNQINGDRHQTDLRLGVREIIELPPLFEPNQQPPRHQPEEEEEEIILPVAEATRQDQARSCRPRSDPSRYPPWHLHVRAAKEELGSAPQRHHHGTSSAPNPLAPPQDGEPRLGASARGMPQPPAIRPLLEDPGQMQPPPGQGTPSRPPPATIFIDAARAAPLKSIAATSTPSTLGTGGPPLPRPTPAAATDVRRFGRKFRRRDLAPRRRPREHHGREAGCFFR